MMLLGELVVLVMLCTGGMVNTKLSLVAPTMTTLVKQQNKIQPSIDGQQRAKPTLKGQLSSTKRANLRDHLKSIRRTKPTMVHPTSYLSLAISCHDAAIEVTTRTLDPFSGVVYAGTSSLGGKGSPGCKVEGQGRHSLTIGVKAGKCGWKRDGPKVRLLLYLQYDAHVQQAVDEQLTVECDMRSREGRLVTLGSRMGVPLTSTSLLVQQGFSFTGGEDVDKENEVDEDYEANSVFDTEEERKVENDLGEWRGLEEEQANEQEDLLGDLVVGKRKEEVVLAEEEIEVVKDDAGELVFLERVDEEVEEEKEDEQETDIVKTVENVVENEVHLVGWLEVVQDGRVVKEVSPEDSVSLVARVGGLGAEQATLGECREEGGRQLTPHCGQVASQWSGISGVRQLSALLEVPELQGRLVVVCSVLHCTGPCTSCRGGRGEIALRAEVQVGRGPRAGHREAVLDQLQSPDQQLCLSPSRIVLAFALSCLLWMNARRKSLPRPRAPVHRMQPQPW